MPRKARTREMLSEVRKGCYNTSPAPACLEFGPAMLPARLLFAALAFLLTFLPAVSAHAADVGEPFATQEVTYEKDVRPILKAYCFQCHGEEEELAGGLDLRLRKTIAAGGHSGPAFDAGDADDSLLLDYVESGAMPPQDDQQLTPEEVTLIRRWLDAGAPAGPEPERVPAPGEFFITAAERDHWAFQPITPADPELIVGEQAVDNPVDAFVGQKLAEHGLDFSPEADRVTLIRRATFDLTGLPPTVEEVNAFLSDTSPGAYHRLIDRLLASPHYGERWGRHWLDVAGYADSEGYTDTDSLRPDAWPYRDYVVDSFNADKPWDQFVLEQLAGDELLGATHAEAPALANSDVRAREKLTATGFLRLAPDGTGDKPMDPELAKKETITATVNVVSSALLGMTVGCAECHDHRFDPIPQVDFYRLRAIFEPVLDPTNWKTPAQRRVAILSAEQKAKAEELEAEAKKLVEEHDRIKEETVEIVFQRVLETIPEDKRAFAVETFNTPAKERTEEQKMLFTDELPMLNVSAGRLHLFLARYEDGEELKEKYEKLLEEANQIRAEKPQPDQIRVATEEPQKVPTTHLFDRGDHNAPLPAPISPGALTVLEDQVPAVFPEDDEELPTTGRRLAFARSLVSGDHPLVPRVLINRFWMHHFGQAFVDSTGDFGSRAHPPSHPELLDWLAADFVRHGWKLKRFHRLVMTSRTYRQASTRSPEAEEIDADNRLLWRMPVRRLESEAVRDAILAISGELTSEAFGPPVPVTVDDVGLVTVSSGPAGWKRSLYTQYRRTQPVYLLEAFDNPNMEPNCEQRTASTVATQSLTLMNDPFIVRQAKSFADRVARESGENASLADRITHAWRLAYGRPPTEDELQLLKRYVAQQSDDFQQRKLDDPERYALSSLCQVIFASNTFLYID